MGNNMYCWNIPFHMGDNLHLNCFILIINSESRVWKALVTLAFHTKKQKKNNINKQAKKAQRNLQKKISSHYQEKETVRCLVRMKTKKLRIQNGLMAYNHIWLKYVYIGWA